NDAGPSVEIELGPAIRLRKSLRGANPARRRHEEIADVFGVRPADVPLVQRIAYRHGMDGRLFAVDQAGAIELTENRHDAAGAMDILDMDVVLGRSDLAKNGN